MSDALRRLGPDNADGGVPPGQVSRDELVLAPRLRVGDRVRLGNGPVFTSWSARPGS